MNKISLVSVLLLIALASGCTITPIRYVQAPVAYTITKVCDPSGWNCQNFTTPVYAAPQQQPSTVVVGTVPAPVYAAPQPMYYEPQPTYYNPLIDLAVGAVLFHEVFGGHRHH